MKMTCMKMTEVPPGSGGWCGTGRGVFHFHPVTPLSFKSDDSNFVQNYFGVGSMAVVTRAAKAGLNDNPPHSQHLTWLNFVRLFLWSRN